MNSHSSFWITIASMVMSLCWWPDHKLIASDACERFPPAQSVCDADPFRIFSVDVPSANIPPADRPNQLVRDSNPSTWTWQLLPSDLLWHSYWADPHEPRISTILFRDDVEGIFWDATVGGRVGLLRYGTTVNDRPAGWQWDLEGAVITRLDLLHAEDVESMDYRFGSEITAREGAWSMKLGYFHISSHVGDEYVVRNPLYQRTNYVAESLVAAIGYQPTTQTRVYGEIANAFHVSDGAKRYQFQIGAEWQAEATDSARGVPFAAVHLNFREAVDYDVSTTAQAGWLFGAADSYRSFRMGFQFANGPTSQYQFFERRERYLGVGLWYDY